MPPASPALESNGTVVYLIYQHPIVAYPFLKRVKKALTPGGRILNNILTCRHGSLAYLCPGCQVPPLPPCAPSTLLLYLR